MNGRFQIAIHILTLLNVAADDKLSSEYIAGSVNANPALIRKELSSLRNYGLIASKEGKNGGYCLGKPAKQIKLSDIYRSIQQPPVLGKAKNQPNPGCPVGKQISGHLNTLNLELDEAMIKKLHSLTLADFAAQFK